MSNLSLPSSQDSTTLSVPKLRDDGSNWADYKPRIRRAMGAKGIWMHAEGKASAPKPYQLLNGIAVLLDGKTPASEDQIEAKETQIIDYEKHEYLAQHVLLSTTSTCVGATIKNLTTCQRQQKPQCYGVEKRLSNEACRCIDQLKTEL